MKKYSIGIDFGTLSGRILVVDAKDGTTASTVVIDYLHGVMSEYLDTGEKRIKLPDQWALQDPSDYLDVLRIGIPQALKIANVQAKDVIGIGIDFTASTIMPLDHQMKPLCTQLKYKYNPHAYVKLWKHHAAQKQADCVTKVLRLKQPDMLKRYGGGISSEWLIPKVVQIIEDDPDVYRNTYRFIEAGDYVTYVLTGRETRNSCAAGYKGLWHKKDGYPDQQILKSIHPELENFVKDKLNRGIVNSVGTIAGKISESGSKLTGLVKGTPVAVATIDAHAAVIGASIADEGKMLMIMGTSTCHLFLTKEEKLIEGISGVVEDGIISGFFGYEAGQACVGDHFDWLVNHIVPDSYHKKAKQLKMDIYHYLGMLAAQKAVGETGLIALDWWNGVRSTLNDVNLTGMILGMNLNTKVEDIYRALVEAIAFGTKIIVNQISETGIVIDTYYASGGISQKNALLMQTCSDVLNKEIHVIESKQAGALGSAIFGSVVAGEVHGGYDNINDAVSHMSSDILHTFHPHVENAKKYESIFKVYQQLYTYFGHEDIMKKMINIKKTSLL